MQQHIGQIDWLNEMASEAPPCPACGSHVPKRLVLETLSAIPQKRATPMRLVACPHCGSRYWTDLSSFHYEDSAGFSWGNRFYVEQGASVDGLIEPIARLPAATVRNCLEIGCGYGFSLDAGQVLFGWRTVGVDPSPLAQAGREALGLDIRPIYADADTKLGGPFDVVYASEVIEHVADPHAFLRICRAHLAPSGTLILTTPDGDSIRPDVPSSALMPILAPGHHLVLFNADSLRRVVHAAGFAFTQIVPREYGLVLYAADRPLHIDGSATLSRALYSAYLTNALEQPNRPPDLRAGLRYRLFKELVNAADHAAALTIFDEIAADYGSWFGLTLSPDAAAGLETRIRSGISSDDFAVPFCLPGLFFFRGIIALNGSSSPADAAPWFDAAALIAAAFRTAYRTVGVDDGETGMIERNAPELAVLALCHSDPDLAVGRARAMPHPPQALFTRLLDLGHLRQAGEAEPLLSEPQNAAILAGRGRLAILRSDPTQATELFARAAEAAAPDEVWAIRYQWLEATILAADAIAAQYLVWKISSAGDRVPAKIRHDIAGLLRDHPAIRPSDTLFSNLVDLGRLALAADVEPTIAGHGDWGTLKRRGMMALLHTRDPASAADLFGKSADVAPEIESWDIRYHQLLALISAGHADAAKRLMAELVSAGDAMPAAIETKLVELQRDHPAIRPTALR